MMTPLTRRPHLVPALISAAMLLAAIGRWPYGYFVLMRWVVCSSAVFVAVVAYKGRRYWGTWLYGLLALLFNPIIPVHLSRGTWRPLDVVAGIAMVISIVQSSEARNRE
jgi:hypothetical protein